MTAGEFIPHRYGTDFDGYLAVWDRQSQRTRFISADELPELGEKIDALAAVADVYAALGLQAEKLDPRQRGKSDTVIALPGFFADIDFASAKESAKRYPEDEAQALECIGTFAFAPTAIIRTGGGLHVHWQLAELFECATDERRATAKRIWTGFQRLLSRHFLAYDREIDSVGDLTRNYRLPGTFNHKTTPPKPVELIEFHPERRYAIAEIEEAVGELSPALNPPQQRRQRKHAVRPTMRRLLTDVPGIARSSSRVPRPAASRIGTRVRPSPLAARMGSASFTSTAASIPVTADRKRRKRCNAPSMMPGRARVRA